VRKKTLHSNQLLSRYQMERDQKTRLISVLARQLERSRDMLPTWVEQQGVVRTVVSRVERQLSKRSGDIEHLLAEREQVEKFYTQKYDALVRCLSQEQERALASMQAKKRELEQSLKEEQETTQELLQQEKTNDELRATLDRTVSQLETVQNETQQVEMLAMQADSYEASFQAEDERRGALLKASPELLHARARIEAQLTEKDQTVAERHAAEAEIRKAKSELERQRAHAAKMEDFVRKLMQGNTATGYLLDPASKREAAAILASAAKLQAARLQRPDTFPRRSQSDASLTHSVQDPFYGRTCAACDEYDVRWPPPSVQAGSAF